MKYEFVLGIAILILMLISFGEAAISCPVEPLELNHNEEITIKNSIVSLTIDPSKPALIRCYEDGDAIVIKKDNFYSIIEVGNGQEKISLNLINNCLKTQSNELCTIPERRCENEFRINNDKIEKAFICYENKNIGTLNLSNNTIIKFGCKFKFYESTKIKINDTRLNIFPSKVSARIDYQCKNITRRFDVLGPTTINIIQESGEYKFIFKGENSFYRKFGNVIDFKSKGILYYSPDEDIIELKDGELNINEAIIKGKDIRIGYSKGESIEELTRKYDIAIKDTDLILSKSTSLNILLGGKNIEIKNGIINNFVPGPDLKENRPIKIYSENDIIVECNELSCKTGDALKITMAPYFAKQISNKIKEKAFFTPEIEKRLDIYPSKIKVQRGEGESGGEYDDNSDRIAIIPLHLVGTGVASESLYVHEFMHAVWYKELTNEQKIAFDKDHEKYRKEYGFDLGKMYGFAKVVTAVNNFIWGTKFGEFKTETIEGWAYTAQDIYRNCYNERTKTFPDYILRHYEGIISEECLNKARANQS